MKICIDALGAALLKKSAIGVYTKEFLNALISLYPQPEYTFIWEDSKENVLIKEKNIKYVNLNIDRKNNEYKNIEEYIEKNHIHIYHCPNNAFSIPENIKCKYVSTVYTMLPIINPDQVDEKYLRKFNQVFKKGIKNSDAIIAISKEIKKDLQRSFKIPEGKIQVIYPACSEIFKPKEKNTVYQVIEKEYNLKPPYILFVGSIHIRKNLEKIITIFKELAKEDSKIKLVIVGDITGKRQKYFLKLKDFVQLLNLEKRVIFLGQVPFGNMPYLYNGAEGYINLSQYEGFPFSALEAIHCRIPVICSNEEIFKETLGEYVEKVDSNDFSYIADILKKILYEKEFRENLLKKQENIVGKYSWNTNINEVVRLYERLFQDNNNFLIK